jgi:hypothetical protein
MTCTFEDCGRVVIALGLCSGHYGQQRRGADLTPLRKMAPRGTGSVNSDGYVMLWKPNHPNAQSGGRIAAHRYVMSEHLGRPLLDTEEVHHKNGKRTDNRLENLELWARRQPPGQRVEDLVRWAHEIIELYG